MDDSKESTIFCRGTGLSLPESPSTLVKVLHYRKTAQPPPARTLICNCIPKQKNANKSMSMEEEEEEEEEEADGEEEGEDLSLDRSQELQLEDIRAEVEQRKAHIDRISRMLSLPPIKCPPVDICVDMQVELQQYEVHPELLALQRNNHKLAKQLQQLHLSRKAVNLSLQHLRQRVCRDLEMGMQMQRRLNALDSFKRTLEHQQGLCRQRHRQLELEKYDWDSCRAHISSQAAHAQLEHTKFISFQDYAQAQGDARELINRTKLVVKNLHDFLAGRMHHLTSKLELSGSQRRESDIGPGRRIASEIALFLHRNEHLFGKVSH